jgi:hypothetical protein
MRGRFAQLPDRAEEPEQHHDFLASARITGMDANASDKRSGAFLFGKMSREGHEGCEDQVWISSPPSRPSREKEIYA